MGKTKRGDMEKTRYWQQMIREAARSGQSVLVTRSSEIEPGSSNPERNPSFSPGGES